MKGIVFTELMDMVEETFGYEMVDQMLDACELESNGAYTAVGTYKFEEMQSLLTFLSTNSGLSIGQLMQAFGRYLFNTFQKNYGVFFAGVPDSFTFLESIEDYIHVEVLKLYPDAELPRFSTERVGDKQLIMEYHSERKMGPFAYGLIEKTLEHFEEEATINQSNLNEEGSSVRFEITKA